MYYCLQEICENPQFIVGGASRTDICQGDLGKLCLFKHNNNITVSTDIDVFIHSVKRKWILLHQTTMKQLGGNVSVMMDSNEPQLFYVNE